MIPVVFRSASGAQQNAGTTLTISKPSGVVSGDLLVCIQAEDADGTTVNDLTHPSTDGTTWTTKASQAGGSSSSRSPWVKIWYRITTSADDSVSNYTFGDAPDDSTNHTLVILAFVAGTFDPSSPLGTPAFTMSKSSSKSTSHVAPSVTGVVGGMLVCGFCADTGGTNGAHYTTVPSGMTAQEDIASQYVDIGAFTQSLSSTAATGTKTATCSVSSGRTTTSFVITPSPATPSYSEFMPFFSGF